MTVTAVAEDGSVDRSLSAGTLQVASPEDRVTPPQGVVEPAVKATVPVGVVLPLGASTVAVKVTVLDDDHVTVLDDAVTVVVVEVVVGAGVAETPNISATGPLEPSVPTATHAADDTHETLVRLARLCPLGSGSAVAAHVVPARVAAHAPVLS